MDKIIIKETKFCRLYTKSTLFIEITHSTYFIVILSKLSIVSHSNVCKELH